MESCLRGRKIKSRRTEVNCPRRAGRQTPAKKNLQIPDLNLIPAATSSPGGLWRSVPSAASSLLHPFTFT